MTKRYPFKFLDAYTREDNIFYFGRDEEIALMYEMVFQTNLLLVYGPSGTGKTSLIQCGLASKFDTHDWLALTVRRGNDINNSLEKALIDAGGVIENSVDDLDWLNRDWSSDTIEKHETETQLAKRIKAVFLKYFKPIYLIFDQFEELYILGNKEEQNKFIETVKEVLHLKQPLKVIISIREEYLGYLYDFERKVPELLQKKLRVEPMTFDKVKSVIQGVAKNSESNITLKTGEEDVVAEQVFRKVKGEENKISINLPYLQVFLDKLYMHTTGDESRKAEAVFSIDTLNKLGDIGDVLRNLLDEQVQQISIEKKLKSEFVWSVLSPFVTLEGTKEPLSLDAICLRMPNTERNVINQILQFFVNKRILRYTEDEQVYEIAHDSLAKQIQAKRSDEEISILEVQRLIKSHVNLKEESREFFTERQLLFIEPFIVKIKLSLEEKVWIDSSRNFIEKQKEAEKIKHLEELTRTRKRLRTMRALLAATAIVLFFAGWQYFEANSAKKVAEQKSVEADKSLNDYKNEQSAKLKLEFENLNNRANIIFNAGGIPSEIILEMRNIAKNHPDSTKMFEILNKHK